MKLILFYIGFFMIYSTVGFSQYDNLYSGNKESKNTYRGLFIPDGQGGLKAVSQEKRIALVIGNRDYKSGWGKLVSPISDALLIENSLKECGFEVMRITDAGRQTMIKSINEFTSKISENETVALVYYAGHGLEVDNVNYLIPVDDASACRDEIVANGISHDYIVNRLKNRGTAMNIIIVDACRNQPLPFTCTVKDRSAQNKGFADYRPKGTIIAYSTSPGKTAADIKTGTQNSPYALALSKALRTEGLKIEDVFKQVLREMSTNGDQEPWVSNAFSGDFYFKGNKSLNVNIYKPADTPVKTESIKPLEKANDIGYENTKAKTEEKISDCQVRQVGDICFVNNTGKYKPVYIKPKGRSTSDRKLTLQPGQTQCFYELKKGAFYYQTSPLYTSVFTHSGEFYVEPCKTKTVFLD